MNTPVSGSYDAPRFRLIDSNMMEDKDFKFFFRMEGQTQLSQHAAGLDAEKATLPSKGDPV